MSTRETILRAMDVLVEALATLEPEPVVVPTAPTDEEVSMNVAGVPDLYLKDPGQYAKMAKYYDPEKEPFTSETWVTMGMIHADRRPYKVIEKDGKPFQRHQPQAGPDWYWIAMGVSDVTAKYWNHLEMVHGQPEPIKMDNCRNYKGGLRQPITVWPEPYRKAYESGRD